MAGAIKEVINVVCFPEGRVTLWATVQSQLNDICDRNSYRTPNHLNQEINRKKNEKSSNFFFYHQTEILL